jgi:outer membrane protein
MAKKTVSLILLILCAALAANAEPALTVGDCIARALKQNPDILKAQKGMDASKERRWQSVTSFLPSVSINALETHLNSAPPAINFAALLVPGATPPKIAGNPLLQYGNQDNYSAYLRISQPLFAGGRNYYLWKASRSDLSAREAELKMARSRVTVEVIKAFYGIMVAREMEKLAREAIAQLQRHLETVRSFSKAGSATEYDSLKTEAQLTSWSPRLVRAQRDLRNATRRLAVLIGEKEESDIALSGELLYEEKAAGMSLEDAKKKALDSRPEMEATRAMEQYSSMLSGAKRAALLPQLNLQYNNNLSGKNEDFSWDKDTWYNWWDLRVILSWDVFGFGRRRSELEESRLREEQSRIDLGSAADRIRVEVEDVYDALNESKTSVEAWKKNMELDQRGYEIAENKYRNGAITNVEFLDSHVELLEAKAQYLKALYDYKAAEAEYDRAVAAQ